MSMDTFMSMTYVHDIASENLDVKVITMGEKRELRSGKAIDLKNWNNISGWLVVEVIRDTQPISHESYEQLYNCPYIISII